MPYAKRIFLYKFAPDRSFKQIQIAFFVFQLYIRFL